ncbi:bifunctional tetrahydrofolate synthase/dihydrofolate synthase [Testudinibacter sp. TR-2022]|nr:bifunctional tetrahydrofolate synthase/dihydrofolate synthase [Testudinibacter sp. TR-2022]TNH07331.1 bifunctional tetrahydrofolate synthase/dihydrofolate synthase [Pasteurellaceae bacterium Phil11]TNH22382.1 bifunctional tetrahydrofolate synthase/dihydrofolate synthase [Testudinibacter sp. TR-2022]TNH29006.1 bifunctional tetrahydrofolate synthase/dihydrofolate synthase [Testudinibacter sp. TR-2022]
MMKSSLQATSSLEKWLCYIEQSHSKVIDMGLGRVKRVAEQLNLLCPAPFVITVGGTNGKGTTCRLLEMLLLNAGLRVGVYSSPHLLRYTERVRIQNQELPEAAHSASFYFLDQNRTESLSYFEFSTLSALYLFKQAQLDVVILEVGLGGRLDATNIVDSDISVITSIDIDHVDYLGDNREKIGYEKAGIFRAGKRAVIGEANLPDSVVQYAAEIGCELFCRDKNWSYREQGETWQWQSQGHKQPTALWQQLPMPHIPLANAATALAVCCCLPFQISVENIVNTLMQVELSGRFQTISAQRLQPLAEQWQLALADLPQVIVDVGHNPHAARYLAQKLQQLNTQHKRKVTAVFAMLKDKDAVQVVEPLAAAIQQWYFADLNGYRGQSAEQLKSAVAEVLTPQQRQTAITSASVTAALKTALCNMQADELLLIFGSFFTVAEFLALLEPKSAV